MFSNFFIFIVTASVLAGNLSAASDSISHGPDPAPLNSTELNNQTTATNLGPATVPNNTKEENKNTNQTDVDHNNNNVAKSTIDNNIALDVTGNVTDKHTIEPKEASKTNDSSTDGQKTVPSTPINKNATQGDVSASNVHGNESAKLNPSAPSKANVTAASIQPVSTSSGAPKWQAILITAAVVIVGCCGVILVKRSLRSERGQAWLERTRRQANVPCRDYEVQYLVIRDSDD
ncbi:hypothetical protein ABMA27_010618 [Loxostege sticticalis]|uniref:Uncharacterized protein n=1 Tax=Loxostege sticticalis TaxID=481309 RepID=A0ABR3H3R1_LOXSC